MPDPECEGTQSALACSNASAEYMKQFLLGIVVCLIGLPLLALLYINFGFAPVATDAPPFPFEKKIAQAALNARVSREAPMTSPVDSSPENLLAGARLYGKYCAFCHGTRGEPKTAAAVGMYPPPPQLMQGKGVTDDPVGETYWKVANGIRLTGMPAYKKSLSETELWQVSQMLANAQRLPPGAEELLKTNAAVVPGLLGCCLASSRPNQADTLDNLRRDHDSR
jgi:thiosulfate dehydrogenase